MSDSSTLQVETPVTEAPVKESKRGRSKRDSYLEENSITTISEPPNIPDQFDPDRFKSLQEANFEDTLHYHQHRVNLFTYQATREQEKVDKLSAMPQAARKDFAKSLEAVDALAAHVRKLQGMEGVDISELLARVTTTISSAAS